MKKNLASLLIQTLEINSGKNLLASKEYNKWVWRDKDYLLGTTRYCIQRLKDEGVGKGSRVAYKGKNSLEWISWNIATNSLGAIWVPMYENQKQNYVQHVLSDCNPKLLITDDKEITTYKIKKIENNVETYLSSNAIQNECNDISTLIYTSGTTGKPKGVILTNENIISNIFAIRERFHTMPQTTSLNILPWAHIYSQTCELYYNIMYDNKLAICSNKENFIKEIKEIQPNVLYLVPRVLDLIKSKVDYLDGPIIKLVLPVILKQIFGNNLKYIFTGGAKLEDSTLKFFEKYNYIICQGYGCSETAPMISVNHMYSPRNIQSIGRVIDNVLVEIVNDEIQVSGPNVMMGYWNQPELTKDVLIERDDKIWYKTGDSGYLKDGYLYYTGRISDNYKLSNGKFVNVERVESIVKRHVDCSSIIFTRDGENNELLINKDIGYDIIDMINNDLNKYLQIKHAYFIKKELWDEYLTPKMSIKRKSLLDDFNNNKIETIKIL